jgi:flagellar motor protein MotB
MNRFRAPAVVAVGLASLFVVTACKSSPCTPPACMAEQPVVAPPPSACKPPPAVAYRRAPAPVVAARPDPEMQARIDALRTSVEAQQRNNAQLEAKIQMAEAASKPAPAAYASTAAGGAGEQAARRLAEELKGVPGAQVLVEGSSAVVVVTDSFDSGSDRLKNNPDLHAALRAASSAIARHPEAKVTVTGHTDTVPIKVSKWSDNKALSKARADAVAKALASGGVTSDRLKVSGAGSDNPLVSPEKTSGDRARNRRVEVEFAFGAAR